MKPNEDQPVSWKNKLLFAMLGFLLTILMLQCFFGGRSITISKSSTEPPISLTLVYMSTNTKTPLGSDRTIELPAEHRYLLVAEQKKDLHELLGVTSLNDVTCMVLFENVDEPLWHRKYAELNLAKPIILETPPPGNWTLDVVIESSSLDEGENYYSYPTGYLHIY